MKHIAHTLTTFLLAALFAGGHLFAANPLAPDAKLQGVKNEVLPGATLIISGTVKAAAGSTVDLSAAASKIGTATVGVPFSATATLTSAAAATPVTLLADTAVPAGKKVYITNYYAKVNGGVDWATTSNVKIQDSNGTPVVFVTLTASTLDANEFHGPLSDSATIAAAMSLSTGGTAAKGLQIVGDANGTGSDLVVTITGFIK